MTFSVKLLHWLPRIICILAILFVSSFAADAFEPGHFSWQQLISFCIHLIPAFVLFALLILAWKRELIGGILFMVIGIVMSPVIFFDSYNTHHFSIAQCIAIILVFSFPLIIAGILFVFDYRFRKKHFSETDTIPH
jgi:hypothetical protein